MADLAPAERLQPSLLDRLTDDEPDKRVEGRDRSVISPNGSVSSCCATLVCC
jgi:type VI secretion system protein ImpF